MLRKLDPSPEKVNTLWERLKKFGTVASALAASGAKLAELAGLLPHTSGS